MLQDISAASSNETRQLLDITKRQQMEHVESFAEMKSAIEKAMQVHDDYIKVSQMNINLKGQLEDYKKQARTLLDEIHQKDEEIGQLKQSLAEKGSDVSKLGLT